ncbi:family 78 glycoside hydrolase catalytic domain [Hymenobacter sp. RP-2-7]|uniref:alpha-L-rhamnosidase n=1 Tax=Hymenobacter polaris TaxID=2682546 RepID=A0A7Y0AAL5_9BACT|nr:alpha-L-rhamnosidase [Hymenobacter polaris]NML63846.1 family 78 glycoside hydrolase catalytic domain [Hymenobacter polaris]
MKNILILLLALGLLPAGRAAAQVRVQSLRCENLTNPLGLDVTQPRFSWQLRAPQNRRGVRQTAYELRVAASVAGLGTGKKAVWQSGKVVSDSSVNVTYAGPALQAQRRYYWQVRAWDNAGHPSAWSAPAYWQVGLLTPTNWTASWIAPGYAEDSVQRPSPVLRKEFVVRKKLASATAYVTAHGLYEAQLNGHRVGDAYLTPGWTSYTKRLAYQTYDVTNLLQPGANAVGATLASGWYRGFVGFDNVHNIYGRDIALLLQLHLVYADGSTEDIGTDATWQTSAEGPIRRAELQRGETYDARRAQLGWAQPGYAALGWVAAQVRPYAKDGLFASFNEPIRAHETFTALKVSKSPKGETILDFGQNLVGWVRVKARGRAGDKVTLSHSEVLDKHGNFYLANLRSATAEDTYYLRGTGQDEAFEPHFTFHGFRYLRLDAYPGPVNPADFTAVALYSDMPATGSFSCSNPLVNQLQSNIQWGQKGNFLDVPTDCPQRDERLGWTGDAEVFSATAAFNRNTNSFFAKWLCDLAADQGPDGAVPFVVPSMPFTWGKNLIGAAGWSDAATVIPWDLYTVYGDRRTLAVQYPSMQRWVKYIEDRSRNGLWDTGFQFGDWLAYDVDDDNAGRSAVTSHGLVAQCFWARSTQLLLNAAQVLGKTEDAAYYTALLARIKAAFVREYVTGGGALMSNTQTAYVLALQFDMLPENLRAQAADRLVQNVAEYNNHLTTGFLGTPYLCQVLSRFGHADVAYKLLLQKTYPSWLYPVTMGATTVWERWNSMRPDSTFAPPSMTSFNHYAYGAIGNWLYTSVAGLTAEAPGYHRFAVRPQPGGGFTQASAQLETVYGPAQARWQTSGTQLALDVTVPPNTTATVYVPAASPDVVREGLRKLDASLGTPTGPAAGGYVPITVGSGQYHFTAPWPAKATATLGPQ